MQNTDDEWVGEYRKRFNQSFVDGKSYEAVEIYINTLITTLRKETEEAITTAKREALREVWEKLPKRIKSIIAMEPHEIVEHSLKFKAHPNPVFNDGFATGYNTAITHLESELSV